MGGVKALFERMEFFQAQEEGWFELRAVHLYCNRLYCMDLSTLSLADSLHACRFAITIA
jgi:hypothetical protein